MTAAGHSWLSFRRSYQTSLSLLVKLLICNYMLVAMGSTSKKQLSVS
jgi:hypothetical protein